MKSSAAVMTTGSSICLDGWPALFQRPAEMGEVAVVMRGTEGTGKGTLAKAILRVVGQHGIAISNPKHLVGNFNAHLRDAVFLFADEAFFAGDKAHVGVLKSLITEPTLTVEAKYQNAVQTPNFLHVIMASNEEWVVPAGKDARRFFVLDVSTERLEDHAYFQALNRQMEHGGYEAMLHDLLAHDIATFNVRAVPATDGLSRQKKLTLGTTEAWWLECLERGYVYASRLGLEEHFSVWTPGIPTKLLHASYSAFARDRKERHPITREGLGEFMKSVGGEKRRFAGVPVGEHMVDVKDAYGNTRREARVREEARPWGYLVGDLTLAREAFAFAQRIEVDWDHHDV